MLSRIFWRIITPRQLRRVTLAFLLVWAAVSFADYNGTLDGVDERLPSQIHVNTDWAR